MSLQGALAALLLGGPAHGYQLQTTLEAELGPLWETRASQLYLTLARMQRDGLVTAVRVRQGSRPDRQLLELTAAGQAAAERWLTEPGARGEIVVRLAVARIVVPHRLEELAGAVVDERSAVLAQLRSLRERLTEGFQPEALEAEITWAQAEVRWAAAVRDGAARTIARPRATRRPAARGRGVDGSGEARPA